MKFAVTLSVLMTMGMSSVSFAQVECRKSMDNLFDVSGQIGIVASALPDNTNIATEIVAKLNSLTADEKTAIEDTTTSCMAKLGGSNKVACAEAVLTYSRVSREIGFTMQNRKGLKLINDQNQFADTLKSIIDQCSTK